MASVLSASEGEKTIIEKTESTSHTTEEEPLITSRSLPELKVRQHSNISSVKRERTLSEELRSLDLALAPTNTIPLYDSSQVNRDRTLSNEMKGLDLEGLGQDDRKDNILTDPSKRELITSVSKIKASHVVFDNNHSQYSLLGSRSSISPEGNPLRKSFLSSLDPYRDLKTRNTSIPLSPEDIDKEEKARKDLLTSGAAGRRLSIKFSLDPYKDLRVISNISLSQEDKEKEERALRELSHSGAAGRILDVKTSLDPYAYLKTRNTTIEMTEEERQKEEKARKQLNHTGASGRILDLKTSLDPWLEFKTPNAITPELEKKLDERKHDNHNIMRPKTASGGPLKFSNDSYDYLKTRNTVLTPRCTGYDAEEKDLTAKKKPGLPDVFKNKGETVSSPIRRKSLAG